MRTIKAAEIVQDFTLYPRNNVDSHNVRNLVDAISAGVRLPPVVLDKNSKRLIDGFHRTRAAIQFYGEGAEVEAIEKAYKNDAEMFLDAMRYNGAHGAKLDPCDRAHCMIIADRLHLPMDAVAGALNMPVSKLTALHADRTATSGGLQVPLKNTVRHFAGRKLNTRQAEANRKLSGMNQAFYANQLIELIESKMLDTSDGGLLERLQHLYGLMGAFCK